MLGSQGSWPINRGNVFSRKMEENWEKATKLLQNRFTHFHIQTYSLSNTHPHIHLLLLKKKNTFRILEDRAQLKKIWSLDGH